MESLAVIINKIQDIFSILGDHNIEKLPYIVLVGAQGSGKSSVLENLVGKSFLPLGTGRPTRAPLVVQMIRYSNEEKEYTISNEKNKNITVWAEFLHKPKKLIFDFDMVRDEIESRTNHLVGNNKDFTTDEIVLKIYNPLFDLTFIDLPGITKVSSVIKSNEVDKQLQKSIIFSYAKKSNSIILSVVDANKDPRTSKSLEIAEKLDPEGIRSLVVITKLDLIDKKALQKTTDLLCGQVFSVKLGIIGVVNSLQVDVSENKTMVPTLYSEEAFLKKNFPGIHINHGHKNLAIALQSTLIMHVQRVYPKIKEELELMKMKLENKLVTLQTPDNKVTFVMNLLKDISKSFEETINGNQNNIPVDEIIGGASIAKIIEKKYFQTISAIDPLQYLSNKNISIALSNTSGVNHFSFINDKALQKVLSRQIKNLLNPSLDCVDLVRSEMMNIFDSIDINILSTLARFPQFNEDVRELFARTLDETTSNTKEFITSYIETYQESIDTTNQDFIMEMSKSTDEGYIQEVLNVGEKIQDDDENSESESGEEEDVSSRKNQYYEDELEENNERAAENSKIKMIKQLFSGQSDEEQFLETSKQVNLHKDFIKCYFELVRKTVKDFVPKRIKHKMINSFVKDLDKRFCEELFQKYLLENKIDLILSEEESTQEEREHTVLVLDSVRKALKNMLEVQYF